MSYICGNFRKNLLNKTSFLKCFNFKINTWSIVFFGSDYYSLYCLTSLHNEMKPIIKSIEVVVVNESSCIYSYAMSNNLKTHTWPPDLNGSYDFGVIVSFGKLITKNIIEQFPLGIINVHASLLPKYRGGMPIVHALKNGESQTGVSVTKILAEKFDIGEILLQKTCKIGKNELMPSLYTKLTCLGSECLNEVVRSMPGCLDSSIPQSGDVSYAPKLKKENAVVKWSEMTALEIFNLHRALFGLFQLSSTFNGKVVKFVCLSLGNSRSLTDEKDSKQPGSFTYNKSTKFFEVQCKDKTLEVCSLKYGQKLHIANSFLAGHLNKVPKNFWKFES